MNQKELENLFYSLIYLTKIFIGISLIIYGVSIEDSTVISVGAFILVYSGRKEAKNIKAKR